MMSEKSPPDMLSSSRRLFLSRAGAVAVVAAGSLLLTRTGWAQDAATPQAATAPGGEEMTSDSYKPVVRPAKPNAVKQMDEKQLEAFERNLACPCPCTLDIYTCRTTDFNCGISPAVHGDIQRLVDGGYSADEIMAAMTQTYGDFILMQPRKQGFNLLAWFAPFAAIALGAVAIGALLRGWRRNADVAAAKRASQPVKLDTSVDATPDELERLQAALREER
ncbi:cytochrome c-type biogenesis protein CcmH [Gemmatimonas sp.]|uniref:cytochrome c-type biogenesis protein n=1 Tax=Gemmatimonas sp. TaxID=1962908 RepID=UPI0039838C7C